MDNACANCDSPFESRPDGKGYLRFSLDKVLPGSSGSAKEVLRTLTDSTFTPVKTSRGSTFLCPKCWALLVNVYKYKQSLSKFWGRTSQSGYIGKKLPREQAEEQLPSTSTSAGAFKKPTAGARKILFSRGPTKGSLGAKWESVISYIRSRKYRRAISGLYNATPGCRQQFYRFVKSLIRKEVRQLLKCDFPLTTSVTLPSVEDFSWETTFERLHVVAPMIENSLKAIATTSLNEDSLSRGTKRVVNLKPYVGTALAGLLFSRAPKTCSFLQTVYSIQLWRGGLKRESIDQFSHTGLCLGNKGTLSAIDHLRAEFDSAAKKCKEELERALNEDAHPLPVDVAEVNRELALAMSASKNIEQEVNSADDDGEDIDSDESEAELESLEDPEEEDPDSEDIARDDDGDDDVDVDTEVMDDDDMSAMDIGGEQSPATPQDASESLHPGFTFCWDNVGKKVTTRHPTADSSNTYINFALAYMSVNRIPSTHLDVTGTDTIPAGDIPMESFIPSNEQFHEVRQRMNVVVSRMLVQHLGWFKTNFSDCVVQHLLHEHSMESAQRSVLVNLGIFEENPSTTQGAIGIYQRLLRYVPSVNNKPLQTLVYGDGLSCERGCSAIKARLNGLDEWARLEGLEPAAQEFHKEMLLLQDHFDEFFKGSSGGEKGTLFYLKNLCNFRNVKGDISDNFSHSWELMCQNTEAFVTLLAMELLGIENTSDRPESPPVDIETDSKEKRKEYLDTICQKITSHVWHKLNTDALKVEATGIEDLSLYCCNEDLDEDFIGCEKRGQCVKGQWFHYSCADVDPENLPNTWYCSNECRDNNEAPYALCYCSKNLGEDEPMIGCSAESRCTQKEWYHWKCVGLTAETVPKGDWFCCQECRNSKPTKGKRKRKKQKTEELTTSSRPDSKYKYNIAVLWSGLNLLCRRDAVREGDGDAMISHWIIDLVQFFRKRHVKYVILAHRLITSLNGWLPEKLRHDLRWNRTINYSGGMGRNLPADLMNELLNRLFKDLLKEARGHYTSKTLSRRSQLVGPLGEAMDDVVDSKIIENEVYRHRRRAVNRDKNVALIVKMLVKERLFRVTPGRSYLSFPAFTHNETPRNAGSFISKMKELSRRLDITKGIVLDS